MNRIKSCDYKCPCCGIIVDPIDDDCGKSLSCRGHLQYFHISCVTGKAYINGIEHSCSLKSTYTKTRKTRQRMTENSKCPICGKVVYWSRCSNSNYAYTVTKRHTKQYFHLDCFNENTRKKGDKHEI